MKFLLPGVLAVVFAVGCAEPEAVKPAPEGESAVVEIWRPGEKGETLRTQTDSAGDAASQLPVLPPLPMQQPPKEHVVRRGDTLNKIARKYGTSAKELKGVNRLTDENAGSLRPGQKLTIPRR